MGIATLLTWALQGGGGAVLVGWLVCWLTNPYANANANARRNQTPGLTTMKKTVSGQCRWTRQSTVTSTGSIFFSTIYKEGTIIELLWYLGRSDLGNTWASVLFLGRMELFIWLEHFSLCDLHSLSVEFKGFLLSSVQLIEMNSVNLAKERRRECVIHLCHLFFLQTICFKYHQFTL